MDEVAQVRRAFADELAARFKLTHAPVLDAVASVPRERFVGPPPWRLMDVAKGETEDTSDPARLYRNVVVPLDADKRLNNGEPGLWATLFERVKPKAGERAIHVGAGTGYFTAWLAQMVGPAGRVTGIEHEPPLAERARANLADWPNAELLCGDGMALARGPADIVVASCGVDHVPLAWVRLLNDGGRMMIPLTVTMESWAGGGSGVNLMVTRRGEAFAAELVGGVGIYSCMSGRTPEAGARLKTAIDGLRADAEAKRPPRRVASLVLGDGVGGDDTWLAGDGWRLSTAPP
ncbi:MAG TPA: methyltransferase domain-containing protein [Caulobacteraceae bacterium]|jgi:protein-L-isoaspartate(D-aspartate) O-methyltransferase